VLRRLGVLVAVGALAAGCGGGESASDKTANARQKQARDVAREAGLSKEVQDFLANYAAAASNKFSVTYEKSPTGSTIVLVQDPPLRRVDVVTPPVTRSVFVTRDGSFDCALDNQKWTCRKSQDQQAPPGLLAPADITRTAAELKAARTNYDFKIVDRKVAKTDVRCLVTTPKAGVSGAGSTLCLSDRGAVLLVEGSGNPLKAEKYETTVDARRLQLPATPEPPEIKP
jgi:hypothetical protein